jgi:predicted DNA-binding protein (UPF0251 family)
MGNELKPTIADLFSMPHREHAALPPNPPKPTADTSSSRHILPSDLSAAIKHLNDQELDQLQAAVATELQRRGKKPPVSSKIPSKRVEAAVISLTPTKLNAIRAAFQAGVRPSKIAKQFGIPQLEVRKALATDKSKT